MAYCMVRIQKEHVVCEHLNRTYKLSHQNAIEYPSHKLLYKLLDKFSVIYILILDFTRDFVRGTARARVQYYKKCKINIDNIIVCSFTFFKNLPS